MKLQHLGAGERGAQVARRTEPDVVGHPDFAYRPDAGTRARLLEAAVVEQDHLDVVASEARLRHAGARDTPPRDFRTGRRPPPRRPSAETGVVLELFADQAGIALEPGLRCHRSGTVVARAS